MLTAKWDITSRCNLRCRHCSVADMYFKGTPIPQLPMNDILLIIDKLADGGVTHLSLLGGEPLTLGKGIIALLDHAHKKNIRISIVSNGTLLNAEMAQELIDHNLDQLVVSIEGPSDKVHDQIRGKGSFLRMLRNVDTFVSLRKNLTIPRLAINSVLTRPNRKRFVEMIPFSRDIGANSWSGLSLNYVGNAEVNLDRLVVPQEEQTQVALEIGMFLNSFDSKQLKVNVNFIYPLVQEYLCKKFGAKLPQPEICCSAGSSLAYISPTGEMHLCDRVHNSPYTGLPLGKENIHSEDLLKREFKEVWNSGQYIEMFDYVHRPETYKGYNPCNRCKYFFDRTCNPCPLYAYQTDRFDFEECLRAEEYLGDISSYQNGPQTLWERAHVFEQLSSSVIEIKNYEEVRFAYPSVVEGVRHSLQPDGTALLMQPRTTQIIKVDQMGELIWHLLDGFHSSEEIVCSASGIYMDIYDNLLANNKPSSSGQKSRQEVLDDISNAVRVHLLLLTDRGYIEFNAFTKDSS